MNGMLSYILGLSLAGGATALIVYALGLIFKKLVKKSWLYYLWLVVLLRFFVPAPLDVPFVTEGLGGLSIVFSSTPAETSTSQDSSGANAGSASSSVNDKLSSASTFGSAPLAVSDNISLLRFLTYVWLTGALALLLWTVVGYILIARKLRQGRTLISHRPVPLYESDFITTPLLAGIIRPRIYLPKGFSYPELAVNHECTHLKRGDIYLKWLVQLTVCVHWFNPLVWLMKLEINRLTEIACDAAVVRGLTSEARGSYGQMLLDTARTVTKSGGFLIASLGRDKRFMAERLHELSRCGKATRKAVAAVVVLCAVAIASAVAFGAFLTACNWTQNTDGEDTSSPAVTDTVLTANTPEGFVNDPEVIGTWIYYGHAFNDTDIVPDSETDETSTLIFAPKGFMRDTSMTWSKGIILVVSGSRYATFTYSIRDIDGVKYLLVKGPDDGATEITETSGETYEYLVLKWGSENHNF